MRSVDRQDDRTTTAQGLAVGVASDPGQARANNEDSYGLAEAPARLLALLVALIVCRQWPALWGDAVAVVGSFTDRLKR